MAILDRSLTFDVNVFTVAIHYGVYSDLTSVLSSIRQPKRREGNDIGVSPNLCSSSAIVLSPLVGDSGVDEVGNSRDTTYEGITLTCSWGGSIINDTDV